MHNGIIEVKLPYPVRFGFISIVLNRKIGFAFNQMSLLKLLENNGIDLNTQSDWLKKTPKAIVISETLFAAAQSYNLIQRKKDNFTKKRLAKALNEADTEVISKLLETWQKSEQFGYKQMPGKKKVTKN